jgi:sugar/nucleoside kinase (ribokinase family)
MKILLIGEINLDIILQGYERFPAPGDETLVRDFLMTLGSSCAITGTGLVRLGHSASFLGKTGDDASGRFCLARMIELGLDVSMTKLDPALKTGVTVAITSEQDRSFVSYLGATTVLTAADVPDSVFVGFDHLHCSSFYLLAGLHPGFEDLYRRAKQAGLTTSLDPACDPAGRWEDAELRAVLAYVDVFLPNEVELRGITGEGDPEAAIRSLANGTTRTIAKLGPRGALATDGGQTVRVASPAVTPVDPTGAGDCFNAGFLHGWFLRRSIPDAMRLGAACGAYSTQALGGTGAQATEEQAMEFLRRHQPILSS